MFAANRVNNGQSHWLDITQIITFLLDIARHVISHEVCADREYTTKTNFSCLSLWWRARTGLSGSHTDDFYFFNKMHMMGTQDHTICTKLLVTMFKWIVERCYECMFEVSNLNRPIFVVSNMETGCKKRLIFSSDLHRGTNNQECYIIIKYEKEILSHSKCLWVKYKFLNVVRLCSKKNLSFQTHKINELADC